jgi:hypothetical protein
MSRPFKLALLAMALMAGVVGAMVAVSRPDAPDPWLAFEADLAYAGCVTRDDVIATIDARDWGYSLINMDHTCTAPAGLSGWITVEDVPEPQAPIGPNSRLFAFDAQGCLAQWGYVDGPSSDCTVD